MSISLSENQQQSDNSIREVPRRVSGLRGAAKGLYISRLFDGSRPVVVISKDSQESDAIGADLRFFQKSASVLELPEWGILPFEQLSPQPQVTAQRLRTLFECSRGAPKIITLSVLALLQRPPSPALLNDHAFELRVGQAIARDTLLQHLEGGGYRRVSAVSDAGDIAVRGAVIDIFSPLSPYPIRLEFFDNTIEEIRHFAVDTQRSRDAIDVAQIIPVREWYAPKLERDQLDLAFERIKERGKSLEVPPREIARIIHAIRSGMSIPGRELYEPYLQPEMPSVLDFVNPRAIIVWNDELACRQALDAAWEQIADRASRIGADHQLIPEVQQLYLPPNNIVAAIESFSVCGVDNVIFTDDDTPTQSFHSETLVELAATRTTKATTGKAFTPLAQAIKGWRKKEYSVALVVGATVRAERLQKILLEYQLDATPLPLAGNAWVNNKQRAPLVILEGHLSQGFQLSDPHVVFVAEHEIFAERSYRKGTNATAASLKRLMSSLAQLKPGDHIVHVDYGIGLYHGLVHLEVEGSAADFLHLEYAAGSKLYLPVEQIGKVQKFSAAEGQTPELDRLGTNTWAKKKDKVKAAVASLAGDLIKLYATRSIAKGWRFEPFGAQDEEFSEAFPFDYTPDQWRSIQDTIADMALDKPMDRLVCGDAGFGKTEVAMMAAHKCVEHARQVGVLVPTTILAQQHAVSFSERFHGTQVRIASLSRFNTPQENKKILADVASGTIDILIGTHRLLSKDIQFKDLGLLIIDEEHRFGVAQKEKLKQLKKQVDVLSLSATPIPRTLHMSLIGIRDISVITTPPTDRQVIRTYVAPYSESLVRDAILRELQRGGQCFLIHNRIDSIATFTALLQQANPEARFEFAHGQMNEEQLEDIMLRFVKREFDVLVSTTIIESGLDIPNANTIIVDRADTFGLAQLYQLRGRVGRSNKQAYAYLMIPKTLKLGSDAQQRLKALQGLDELGLGFNLALRDMEIRGAGNLLGREQSGSVLEVGFELYSKILKEAILNLKGEELDFTETIEPEMKLGVPAFIPEEYIPDVPERLIMYQRLSSIATPQDAEELSAEIADRFGPPPREVTNYVELMQLRAVLRRGAVVRAELSKGKLLLSFSPKNRIKPQKVIELARTQPKLYRLSRNDSFTLFLPRETIYSPRELIEPLERLFDVITSD